MREGGDFMVTSFPVESPHYERTHSMFGKTKENLSNVISVPARNASLLSLVALAVSIVALFVAAAMAVHH